jgi:hypothetical protein
MDALVLVGALLGWMTTLASRAELRRRWYSADLWWRRGFKYDEVVVVVVGWKHLKAGGY